MVELIDPSLAQLPDPSLAKNRSVEVGGAAAQLKDILPGVLINCAAGAGSMEMVLSKNNGLPQSSCPSHVSVY